MKKTIFVILFSMLLVIAGSMSTSAFAGTCQGSEINSLAGKFFSLRECILPSPNCGSWDTCWRFVKFMPTGTPLQYIVRVFPNLPSGNNSYSLLLGLATVEPIGDKWEMQIIGTGGYYGWNWYFNYDHPSSQLYCGEFYRSGHTVGSNHYAELEQVFDLYGDQYYYYSRIDGTHRIDLSTFYMFGCPWNN